MSQRCHIRTCQLAAIRRGRLIRAHVLPPLASQDRATHSDLIAHAAVTLAALVHPDRRARRDPAVFHQAAWPR
jgi:hypothetical protein